MPCNLVFFISRKMVKYDVFKINNLKFSFLGVFTLLSLMAMCLYPIKNIDSTGVVLPWYFKNHDLDGYSAFVADSINEAMKLFEKSYEPIFIRV